MSRHRLHSQLSSFENGYLMLKHRVPIKITAIYLSVGLFWIIFSDQLLTLVMTHLTGVNSGVAAITQFQTVKGLFYVFLTALLLYWLIERENKATRRAIQDLKQALQALQHAQEMLRLSEQKFRSAIINAPYPAILHAENGEIIEMNQVWTELTGYQIADVPTIAEWAKKAYGQSLDGVIRHGIDQLYDLDSRVHEGLFSLRTKGGEERVWDFSSAPVGTLPDGRKLVLSMAVDVTEQEKLEKEKELNRLKTQFISTVSHEFRTPLAIIRTAIELMSQKPDLSVEKRNDYLQRIKTSVRHMNNLMEEVLIMGQTEAERLVLRPTEINIAEFCQELLEEFSMVEEKHSHLLQFLKEGDCTDAFMDEKLLRYILTNLLSNAIKYSPEGSIVKLQLSSDREENIIKFQIQDQGIGIPEAEQAQVFDSFFRASNVTTIQGTGLGLAIVQRCVDAHQGRIGLTSRSGEGTTVTVVLPLRIKE